MVQEHSTVAVSEYRREKRSQRRQILTLLFLGWLLCLLILQIHHPLDTGIVARFGDLNVVWARFNERILAPFTHPEKFYFGIDSLGSIIGATATTLVALVFSGRNPWGMANETKVMALDELLELLTVLVGTAAAATLWMALHNVAFLPDDPDSGPKFFLGMLCLMLVIFSVVRQRDTAAQREIDEFHLTADMRLHTHRWERMWGVSARTVSRMDRGKTARLVLWWAGSGFAASLVSLVLHSGFTPLQIVGTALALSLLGIAAAALTALAVSLYRGNPHPGVGLAYAAVLLVVLLLVVAAPLTAAALANQQVLSSLLSYFLWLAPSLLLMFRKPQSAHMTPVEYKLAARPRGRLPRNLVACFDGAREAAFWIELGAEARRQRHYEEKLARLEAEEAAARAAEATPVEDHVSPADAGERAGESDPIL